MTILSFTSSNDNVHSFVLHSFNAGVNAVQLACIGYIAAAGLAKAGLSVLDTNEAPWSLFLSVLSAV